MHDFDRARPASPDSLDSPRCIRSSPASPTSTGSVESCDEPADDILSLDDKAIDRAQPLCDVPRKKAEPTTRPNPGLGVDAKPPSPPQPLAGVGQKRRWEDRPADDSPGHEPLRRRVALRRLRADAARPPPRRAVAALFSHPRAAAVSV